MDKKRSYIAPDAEASVKIDAAVCVAKTSPETSGKGDSGSTKTDPEGEIVW